MLSLSIFNYIYLYIYLSYVLLSKNFYFNINILNSHMYYLKIKYGILQIEATCPIIIFKNF